MNNNPDKPISGAEARRQIIAAAVGEIRRREGLISRLEQLDESVIVAALVRHQGSPGTALLPWVELTVTDGRSHDARVHGLDARSAATPSRRRADRA